MSYLIEGEWKAGWSLDLHTTSSTMNPDGTFNNTYSDIGKALNLLKYSSKYDQTPYLAQQFVAFMNTLKLTPYLEVIIPAPASRQREIQPVHAIAEMAAQQLKITYDNDYVQKVKDTAELKSIESVEERLALLNGAFNVDERYAGKKVLIFDDLFRSGSTLNELTRTMYTKGKVSNVYVVTLTKTRVHR